MQVRPTTPADCPLLPDLERRAAQAFASTPHAEVEQDGGVGLDDHLAAVHRGLSWVAVIDNAVVGFLVADVVGNALHIEELSVDVAMQRRGAGRRLLDVALNHGATLGLAEATLTTFADVPFNGPWYERVGFEVVASPGPRLAQILEAEASSGLRSRCAMRLVLSEND